MIKQTMQTIQEITNSYQHQVFSTYKDALDFGKKEMGWDESEVLERKETITLEVNNEIERCTLDCLMVDSGSDDYLYFLKW